MIRLVTGASWVDIEASLDHQVSDTTLRARRDEWIDAGVFESLEPEALTAFDRIVGLDLDDVVLTDRCTGRRTAAKERAQESRNSRVIAARLSQNLL